MLTTVDNRIKRGDRRKKSANATLPKDNHRELVRLVKSLDPSTLPPHSFLRIPLMRQAILDPNFRLQARTVDTSWRDQGEINKSVTGFNPFLSTVYYGACSPFADWITDPINVCREVNHRDSLVNQILFTLHDYLHVWCCQMIKELISNSGIGEEPITKKNIEKYTFLHLLTEAAATIGLDYWYLSTVDINDVVNVGTLQEILTISYYEKDLEREYRQFAPQLSVQSPDFFVSLAQSYCNGQWRQFHPKDFTSSPRLERWLKHEINYGALQRRYIRLWLALISEGRVSFDQTRPGSDASVECSKPWQMKLMKNLSKLLWDKIKEDLPHYSSTKAQVHCSWFEKPPTTLDFRFMNIHQVDLDRVSKTSLERVTPENYDYFMFQYVSQFKFSKIDPRVRNALPYINHSRDPDLLRFLFRDQVQLERAAGEPPILLFLN